MPLGFSGSTIRNNFHPAFVLRLVIPERGRGFRLPLLLLKSKKNSCLEYG